MIKSNPIHAGLLTDWRTIIPRVCTDYSQNLTQTHHQKQAKIRDQSGKEGCLSKEASLAS